SLRTATGITATPAPDTWELGKPTPNLIVTTVFQYQKALCCLNLFSSVSARRITTHYWRSSLRLSKSPKTKLSPQRRRLRFQQLRSNTGYRKTGTIRGIYRQWNK